MSIRKKSATGGGLERFLGGCERGVSVITAALLALIMFITVIDTVGRYAMNRPLAGAAEWVELTMGILIFLGIFQATQHSEHIRIDLLDRFWSPMAGRLVQIVAQLASMLVMAFLAWRLWAKALDLHDFGDFSSYLNIPLAPLAGLMALAVLFSSAVCLVQLRKAFAAHCDTSDSSKAMVARVEQS